MRPATWANINRSRNKRWRSVGQRENKNNGISGIYCRTWHIVPIKSSRLECPNTSLSCIATPPLRPLRPSTNQHETCLRLQDVVLDNVVRWNNVDIMTFIVNDSVIFHVLVYRPTNTSSSVCIEDYLENFNIDECSFCIEYTKTKNKRTLEKKTKEIYEILSSFKYRIYYILFKSILGYETRNWSFNQTKIRDQRNGVTKIPHYKVFYLLY